MKGVIILPCILFLIGVVSAVAAYNNIHVNIQSTYSNGSIQAGTFNFVFNISNNSGDCSAANIVYSNSIALTTDSRGIISYYLPNVNLDYRNQYWLCYYRDGVLLDTGELAKVPYAFQAKNVTLSGVKADSNFDLASYNIATTGSGFFSVLGALVNRVTKLFVQDIDASGNINLGGNMTIGGPDSYLRSNGSGVLELGSSNQMSISGDSLYLNGNYIGINGPSEQVGEAHIFSAYENAFSVINNINNRQIFSVDTINGIVTINGLINASNITVNQFNASNIAVNQLNASNITTTTIRANSTFRNVVIKTADYNLSINDDFVIYNISSSQATFYLPSAIGNSGKTYTIMKTGSGGMLFIQAQADQLINNNNVESFNNQYGIRSIISDGTNWYITSKLP